MKKIILLILIPVSLSAYVKRVNSDQELAQEKKSYSLIIAYKTGSCGLTRDRRNECGTRLHCFMQLSRGYSPEMLRFIRVYGCDGPTVQATQSAQPSYLLYRDGKEIAQLDGDAESQKLAEFIEQHFSCDFEEMERQEAICRIRSRKNRWYKPPQLWYGYGNYFSGPLNRKYYDAYPGPGYWIGAQW